MDSRLHGRLEAFHEAQETLEDVGEVEEEPLEAHEAVPKEENTGSDRKKPVKPARRGRIIYLYNKLKKIWKLGKKSEQIHRSPLPKDSIDIEEVEEDTPDILEVVEDSWEALEDENRSTRSRETSFEEKFYNFLEKS